MLKAKMQAYQEWLETNPITVPSSTVDQIITSTTIVPHSPFDSRHFGMGFAPSL